MKSLEEIKQGMIVYVRSDIEDLSEQSENSQINAFWNRVQGVLGAMRQQKMLTDKEHEELHEEVAQAVTKARENEANL